MKNHGYVEIFIHGLSFNIKRIANEKKIDDKPTVYEPVIPFETLKYFVNRKHLAYEMTPKSPTDNFYIEPQKRCSHHLRS